MVDNVILSSPSGAGKTTLQKKFNKNIKILKYQFLTQQENQDLTKLKDRLFFYNHEEFKKKF